MNELLNNNIKVETINNIFPDSLISFIPDKNLGAIHFIGIGGIGMSGLARLLLAKGYSVTGSDKAANTFTDDLEKLGAKIFIGHDAANISSQQLCVVSTAIIRENPELVKINSLNIPVWHRSKLLKFLSQNQKLIGISGTHGKTTTTGMISSLLLEAGLDPSIIIGGYLSDINSNSRTGFSDYFVAEIDESDKSHIDQDSYISLVTNIEADHLENYPGGLADIYDSMVKFANKASHKIIFCSDNKGCLDIVSDLKKPYISYGYNRENFQPDFYFKNLNSGSMEVYYKGELLGPVNLKVPGHHNKLNALAAIAVAYNLDIPFTKVQNALAQFNGVGRRFDIKGIVNNMLIVDDYAHHPTEVASTIDAAIEYMQYSNRYLRDIHPRLDRLVVVFQPHQPKRLMDLFDEFCKCFVKADLVLMADVYIARGKEIPNVNSANLVDKMQHSNAYYLGGNLDSLYENCLPLLQPNDLVITMGAGDITNLGVKFLQNA